MKIADNSFKAALRDGRAQVGVWSTLCSTLSAEIIGTAGFDWVVVDMEHSPNDMAEVLGQLQVHAASGVQVIVRPPWNEPVTVKRLLDIGAFSLLFPMVQNAEEAAAAVAACRYPPRGIRGVSLNQRANRFGAARADYLERAEQEIAVLVQIETRAALAEVDAIAAVDGVDGVFFGPADLSADFGLLGQPTHPEVTEAIGAGLDRVRAAGKAGGVLSMDPPNAQFWLQRGMTFVACQSDQAVLANGLRKLRADIAGG